MREMWQNRGMRLIFIANLVSMIGSGMNSAAVIWYILQATHSEISLGTLIALQTLPSLVLLPFTGVLIDREDRRHLMMWLDAARGLIIFAVAMLVFTHRAHLWQIYAMNILVAIGFWMFFPTVNALIQELTPDDKMLDSNALLLAALQGGWLMAGALVGFVYNHIGLGGVLLIDCASYAVSFACVLQVRKGRVTVSRPETEGAVSQAATGAVARYMHELGEGYRYVRENRRVLLIGIAWALFVAAMMTQGVLSAPLSERILHGGAVGYGWLNAGWAVGAFVSVFYAAGFVRRHGPNRVVTVTMSLIAASLCVLPVSRWLALAVLIYFMMGSSRGAGGIALSSEMMQLVPRHFMGRVQNAFSFVASALQICTALLVGEAAHREGLVFGFWIVGAMYFGAAVAAWLPVRRANSDIGEQTSTAAD
jgi:MFS family permease